VSTTFDSRQDRQDVKSDSYVEDTPLAMTELGHKGAEAIICTIEEIANMAAFAASPECSFTTGFTFDVTGGRATY